GGGIDQEGNLSRLGYQVAEEAQSLCHRFSVEKIDASRIAARPGETGDQAQLDRVFADAEHDRDRRGRGLGRKRGRLALGCGNHGDATADEIGHERWQAIILALQPVVLDHHVLVLNVAGFVEAFAEGSARTRGILGRPSTDKADDRHRWLLCAHPRRKRPSSRYTAEQSDELAAFHSITSSARASSLSEIWRPSTLAAFRLMASSNFVGC